MATIRALEFFSGIGGLHFGFNASGVRGEVLESFDMNQQANDTYKLSFGKSPVSRGIDRLTAKDIEKYNANCWLMSPPCQPYTRGGKLLDDQDNRAKPLLHLLDQLEKMKTPPTYVFLENVKNFETSRSRTRMVTLLHKMGYVSRECLLAPYHFGVPNDRLRYFLMARLRSSFRGTTSAMATETTETDQNFDSEKEIIYTSWPMPAFVEEPAKSTKQHSFQSHELRHFLDIDQSQAKHYLLSRQLILERPNFRFGASERTKVVMISSCFTKAYGSHHVAGGGGLLQTLKMEQEEYDFGDSESIAELGLRFFSPTEVARIHVFPLKEELESEIDHESLTSESTTSKLPVEETLTSVRPFSPRLVRNLKGPFLRFPDKLTALQKYRLLGNSLNVWVVAELLRGVLFADHPGSPLPVYRQY
ncbi:C-5 cytosine-specific DNA methylase [Modicella reniformis]|uniref:tRNA (cytosine(38)-C(5))-methyltransferase n=1 Tax=Modicella reniformis TaxID=1440133 RepID=A0A9P6ILK1_9FUNG|nr:C-5 cytosine-specific DNA methylase [Modicella reniformis]